MTAADDIGLERRINRYRMAVRALQLGRFDTPVAPEKEDALGLLGRDLDGLSKSLHRRFQELNALLNLSEGVGSGLLLDHVLNGVYDTFKNTVPYDRLGCALLDPSRSTVIARWARSSARHMSIRPGFSQPLAGSSLAEIIRTGKPRIINDLDQYLIDHPRSVSTRMIRREGVRSSLTCPLTAQGSPVGFLFFSSNALDTYRELHQEIFTRCAGQLSVIVERSAHYQEMVDINQRLHAAQAALERQANTDALTGLMNRRALMARLDEELDHPADSVTSLGVCIVDIDHFKRINDTYGHLVGDEVLRRVAATLASVCRASEALGRYGGEEFLYVLPGADRHAAECAAERLRAAVAATSITTGNHTLAVTVSVGVTAISVRRGATSDGLIETADSELYTAKGQGRNRVHYEAMPEGR